MAVILRVAPAALRAGRLAGQVELIATGETGIVRDAEELLAFVRAAAETDEHPVDAPGA